MGGVPQTNFAVDEFYDSFHPGSDGKHVYLRHGNNGMYAYEEWSLADDGTWTFARALPISGFSSLYDAYADRLLIADSATVAYDEYKLDGTLAFQHTPDQIGLVGIIAHDVSNNGLHAFVIGVEAMANNRSAVYYTDRAALDTAFSPVRRVANVPSIDELTVADDCSRIYFPALGSIFYLQQD